MFIEVNRIPPEGLEIDRALELQPIVLGGDSTPVDGVRLAGSFRRSRGDVVFRGTVEAVLSLVCSRCAAPVTLSVSGSCHRIFRKGPIGRPASERELDEEDLALTPFDGFRIDLVETAREEIYLLVPLKLNRPVPRHAIRTLRLLRHVAPWGMLEIFMLGILVALVKLGKMATIVPGISVFAFGLLVLVMAAAISALDPPMLWERLDRRP